jgi:hypothetical protein
MTTKEEALPVPQFGMIEPNGRDVLFGRGKNMFNHNGNVRFRLLIQQRSKEYENAPSRRIKSAIVYAIVQTVHGYGGRFLKREKGPVWEVVTASEAIQKVRYCSYSQAAMLICFRIRCIINGKRLIRLVTLIAPQC